MSVIHGTQMPILQELEIWIFGQVQTKSITIYAQQVFFLSWKKLQKGGQGLHSKIFGQFWARIQNVRWNLPLEKFPMISKNKGILYFLMVSTSHRH